MEPESKNIELNDEEFRLLRDFIAQHFGIYFDDEKRWMLESKLGKIIGDGRFRSFFEYYQHLMHKFFIRQSFEDSEFVELLRSITNNETYFDRETAAIDVLIDRVISLAAVPGRRKGLRILSAACSSGEEAFSIAIRLLESGAVTEGTPLEIVGVDIDAQALETAIGGVYKASSFRGLENSIWYDRYQKYFDRVGCEKLSFIVRDQLRSLVSFHPANLLDRVELKAFGTFDAVFCRNMLIYFNEDGRHRVLGNFHSVLNPGGLLFLGHSEVIKPEYEWYEIVNHPRQLYYQKK